MKRRAHVRAREPTRLPTLHKKETATKLRICSMLQQIANIIGSSCSRHDGHHSHYMIAVRATHWLLVLTPPQVGESAIAACGNTIRTFVCKAFMSVCNRRLLWATHFTASAADETVMRPPWAIGLIRSKGSRFNFGPPRGELGLYRRIRIVQRDDYHLR